MFYGVKTGRNEAFEISSDVRDSLIRTDPGCANLIKPMLARQDLRPWYHEAEGRWFIFTRQGTDIDRYPAIKGHLEQFRPSLEPKPAHWDSDEKWMGRKPGDYRWFEIQDTVEYFYEFEKPKIVWPDVSKLPRFSWDESGAYLNNTGYVMTGAGPWLLALLQRRVVWFMISQISQPLRERAGLWQYRLLRQFTERIPIPELDDASRTNLGGLADQITQHSHSRYDIHQSVRARVQTDLGTFGTRLNQKLTAWWTLDFSEFRAEVRKALKREIPVRERDEWAAWLTDRREEHERFTAEIVRLETELNARV